MDLARAISTVDIPFPEPIPAIAFQLILVLAGKKPCCFVPFYSPAVDLGAHLVAVPTARGLVILRRDTPADERDRLLTDVIERPGLALGYGMPDKPKSAHSFVKTLMSSQSVELLTIACDAESEGIVDGILARFQTHAPGSTIVKTSPVDTALHRLAWWTAYYESQRTQQ